MAELRIDSGAWVVVCDGAKALVLENAGSRKTPNLKTREVYEHDDPKTREIGTDRPGRSVSSVGQGRSAIEQADWHDQEEQRFLAKLAVRLDKAVLSGETPSLIVVAPPRAIGCAAPGIHVACAAGDPGGSREGLREDAGGRDHAPPGAVTALRFKSCSPTRATMPRSPPAAACAALRRSLP